jgi:pimeloyl-ACP methyl ester carboxylesterase
MNNLFHFEGARIFYRVTGSGPPLVFLHNGGASHRIWERQVAHFSRTHRCIAFDLPGFGASERPAVRTSLRFHVDWLGAFFHLHRIEHATLVGNCMGSAIALAFASAHRVRASRLVLFHVLTKSTVLAGPYGPFFALEAPRLRRALRFLAARLTTPRLLLKHAVRAHFGSGVEPDAPLAIELARLYRRPGQLAALSDLVVDVDALAALDELVLARSSPPTLMLWGESNAVLPVHGGQALARTLEPHQFVCVSGGGHLVMHEQSPRINRILEEFFDANDPVDRHRRPAHP